ncbi:UNVERIFIED_CONTAM: hypothetical protein RMT77_001743 [Armadillidium vulgare]
MENRVLLQGRGIRNVGAVKRVEAKVKTGALIQRSALGDIHNRVGAIPKAEARKKNEIFKKPVTLKENVEQKIQNISMKSVDKENFENEKDEKENVPTHLPQKFSIIKGMKEEKMEVESTENTDVQQLSVAFSSQGLDVVDIDEDDASNPQLVSEYAKDIYKHLWKLETEYPVKLKYLEGQKVTSRMRAILIDWLVQVHQRFTLLQETLYLTVAILDRYLQAKRDVTKDRLQLVGVASMYIASKYEEMYIPEIGDFAYITDKAFSKKDIRLMEIDILTVLKFYISFPLHIHFLRRNSKAGNVDTAHHTFAKYLLELTLPEYSFCHYKASHVAAAALYLSIKIISNVDLVWNETLTYYSSYKEQQILPLVYKMAALLIKSGCNKQQAIRRKYESSKFMKISKISEMESTSKLLRSLAEKAANF